METVTGVLPSTVNVLHTIIYLLLAALLGGLIGLQRERHSKPAGLRTHMLVAVGTAFFILVAREYGLSADGISRVIQGVATGIGFIGGGVILKRSDLSEIRGLTTAGSLWMTAALGVAVALEQVGAALVGAVLTWLILSVVGRLESRLDAFSERDETGDKD